MAEIRSNEHIKVAPTQNGLAYAHLTWPPLVFAPDCATALRGGLRALMQMIRQRPGTKGTYND